MLNCNYTHTANVENTGYLILYVQYVFDYNVGIVQVNLNVIFCDTNNGLTKNNYAGNEAVLIKF